MNGDLKKIIEKFSMIHYYCYDNKYATGGAPRCGKSAFQHGLNCSDEVVPGSNARRRKILDLMKITEYTDFTETYCSIVHQMHDILLEETMLFLGCTEQRAKLLIDMHVDFNRVYLSEKDGRKYMQVRPIIEKKY